MAQIFIDVTGLASTSQGSASVNREAQIEGLANRQIALGALGATYKSNTTAVLGQFGAIQALADSVFSLLTVADWDGDTTASMPLPAGAVVFGQITAFTLTGGRVVAYKRGSD